MGKLAAFNITFNGNKEVYVPGEFIAGTVVVQLNDSMKMRALKLEFSGKAYVHWSESHSTGSGKNRRTTRRHYSGSEVYFNQVVSLFGQGSSINSSADKLPTGQSIYPFQFQLPINLPSSFESHTGWVRYSIKATIDKPWKFDHNTKRVFTVLDTYDLNFDANSRNQIGANDSKTLCCLCCASGPIEAQMHLDRQGYVPGEFILVNANVENVSSSNLPSTNASLIQTVTYRATTKSRNISNNLSQITGPGCEPHKSVAWNGERLQIPSIPPSFLRYCNIIDIQYTVQYCVVTSGTSINMRIHVPVIIGSIPLQGASPYSMLPPVAPSEPIIPPPGPPMPQPDVPGLNPTAPPSVPGTATNFQAPPPSYMAATGGEVSVREEGDNEHLMGQTSFAPQYTYYDWSQPAFTYNKNQVGVNDSKTLCCLCCASGPIEAQMHLDRQGYVPGEFILVNANVENASSSKLPSTNASLIQTVTYRATTKSRNISNNLSQITGPGCEPHKSVAWNGERLQIPSIPPSFLRFCNIIDIQYTVQYCVVTPGTSISMRIHVPVIIGSIPLQGVSPYSMLPPGEMLGPGMSSAGPPMPQPEVTGLNPTAPPPTATGPTDFQAPPPSYMAATGGEVSVREEGDNEHLMGQTSFAPQYTYYDWSQPAFTYNK